ncbi:hypothetical protein J7T55_000848 [Diaporthe amygdali]|uniref:uncharacterized protein n=1 Tax=Phomopsis amygdali TaxID=1214568 RepID=UPI0022FF417B|nr:uncharacterized protein J7T55_000848 [Diaporthe amygdali]KAJ0119997.1 hypothetical protein J7T55_000848 [Diaporthe amygdali]
MSEYTSTRDGFQRAMEWSLTGPPNETKLYTEALSTPDFFQIMNGQRISYDAYVKGIEEWRAKVSAYKPEVQEFLRDGDQLAARMTGTITVDGVATEFESFMFAKVDGSGRMEWLKERSVWGPAGGKPEHGVN